MSLNKSVPQPLNDAASIPTTSPDYAGLLRFLIQPFLESPGSFRVDCETSNTARVWIRVAFESEDKGRVFGRGGRNIQAIRTVIAAVAAASGQSVYLDIYGSQAQEKENISSSEEPRRVAPIKIREQRPQKITKELQQDTSIQVPPS